RLGERVVCTLEPRNERFQATLDVAGPGAFRTGIGDQVERLLEVAHVVAEHPRRLTRGLPGLRVLLQANGQRVELRVQVFLEVPDHLAGDLQGSEDEADLPGRSLEAAHARGGPGRGWAEGVELHAQF